MICRSAELLESGEKLPTKLHVGQGENTTILAVCNATGRVLTPLIVFAGKNLQSTWRGDRALPGTFYGISQSGWMTTEVFAKWFEKFTALVKERPLLLIFDGHLCMYLYK